MIAVPGHAGQDDRVHERGELADRGEHEEPAEPVERAEQRQEVGRLEARDGVAEHDRATRSSGNQQSLRANRNCAANSEPYGYGGRIAETTRLAGQDHHVPDLFEEAFDRQEGLITGCSDQRGLHSSRVFPAGGAAGAHKPTPAVGKRPSENRRAPELQVVFSARGERVEDYRATGAMRAPGDPGRLRARGLRRRSASTSTSRGRASRSTSPSRCSRPRRPSPSTPTSCSRYATTRARRSPTSRSRSATSPARSRRRAGEGTSASAFANAITESSVAQPVTPDLDHRPAAGPVHGPQRLQLRRRQLRWRHRPTTPTPGRSVR